MKVVVPKIKQIVPSGCNREVFALTGYRDVYLLKYHGPYEDVEFEWVRVGGDESIPDS